jgi:hypothetical protein
VKGKPLSALLQILRSAGVTKYTTPELTLELGPAPPPKRGRTLDEVLDAGEDKTPADDDEPRDWRFALEKRMKHFPRRADPLKNKAAQ